MSERAEIRLLGCRSTREGVWQPFIAGLRGLERTISSLHCDYIKRVRQKAIISQCSIDMIAFRPCLRSKRKSVWRPCRSVCLFICLWSNISCLKTCWIFVKSDVVEWGVSFLKVGVSGFVPAVSVFLDWFAWKLGTENIHFMSFSCCQFQGNRSIESHILSVGGNAIFLIFSTFYIWFG